MCWTVRHGQTTLFERADGSVVWDHGARTLFPTEAEARDALAKAPPPPDIEPKDGSAKVEQCVDCVHALANYGTHCPTHGGPFPTPAPTPKAEPKPRPWPSDLSTLVGKRITQRPILLMQYALGHEVVTGVVESIKGEELIVTEDGGAKNAWTPSCRDLLSIEDAEPKPDQSGDTNEMIPAPFAPLPEGWRPKYMLPLKERTNYVVKTASDVEVEIHLRESDCLWLSELNRLRRELHDLQQQKGK